MTANAAKHCTACGARLCEVCGRRAPLRPGARRCLGCIGAARRSFTEREDRLIREAYEHHWCRGIALALGEVLHRSPGSIRARARIHLGVSRHRGAPYADCAGCWLKIGNRPHIIFRDDGIHLVCGRCFETLEEEGAA